MRLIEPFNSIKRMAALRHQLERKQFASRQNATEIAFHLRGTAQAESFERVSAAIDAMDFAAAMEHLDRVMKDAEAS